MLLKQLMDRLKLSAKDVADATDLSPYTVVRYLAGEGVHKSTVRLLEHWVQEHSQDTGGTAA